MHEEALASPPTFIDLFAGCGGLSLGLMTAGWRGLFAIEKDDYAFSTLRHNLIHGPPEFQYAWPNWLPQTPCSIGEFMNRYSSQLHLLRGQVDLVAGGLPCQSFSFAGHRSGKDRRSSLFKAYLKVVDLLDPKLVFIENVHGIAIEFGKERRKALGKTRGRPPESYATRIIKALHRRDYRVYHGLVRAVDYGIPQPRPRYFIVGAKTRVVSGGNSENPFDLLRADRAGFLLRKGLRPDLPVTVEDAISDLLAANGSIQYLEDRGFKLGISSGNRGEYQRLLQDPNNGHSPDSHRFANHRPETRKRFASMIRTCRHGVSLSAKARSKYGLSKQSLVVLSADKPCHTLTTLPDDFVHYQEPRILTVREYARIQAFPDWFHFKGNYTTGGNRRTKQCPRYTQVGNAVPPLLAEAWGLALMKYLRLGAVHRTRSGSRNGGSNGIQAE